MQTGLYDLLAPQFLVGVELPSWLDEIFNFLRLETLEEAWDDNGIVYYGKAQFVGDGSAQAPTSATTPSGSVFQWEDVNLQFRLTIPRTRSDFIQTAVSSAGGTASSSSPIADLNNLFNRLEVTSATNDPSDYPGVGFQLELMFSAISIHLPKDKFFPAKIAADGWLTRDTNVDHVKISLPKIALNITQGTTIGDINFQFKGWGAYSLDDPADPQAGELIKMEPALCLHESRTIGFGLEKIVLDLSDSFTPPEILEQFGTGDEFKGLWIPHVRFFVAPGKNTGFAFDIRANDLLIDFNQGVSGEFAFDIIRRNSLLEVEPIIYQGDVKRTVTRGNKRIAGSVITVTGSRASVAADGELQLSIQGGYPPYSISVRLDGNSLASSNFNGDPNRLIWLFNNPGIGNKTLNIRIEDSSTPHYIWEEDIELELTTAGVSVGTLTTWAAPTLNVVSATPGYEIKLQANQPDENKIFLTAHPILVNSMEVDSVSVSPSVDGVGNFSIDATPDGTNYGIIGTWTPPPQNPDEIVHFENDAPSSSQIASETIRIQNIYATSLLLFIQRANAAGQANNLVIEGNASYDGVWQESYNQGLSDRRSQVLRQALQNIANGIAITVITEVGHATERARGALIGDPNNGTLTENGNSCGTYPHNGTRSSNYNPACYRNSIVSFTAAGNATVEVTVARPAPVTEDLRTSTERGPNPNEPARPSIFKSIGARIRLERNLLVLAELHGQLDFVTAAEDSAGLIQNTDNATSGTTNFSNNIVSQTGATSDGSATPQDGIVDYKLQMSFDSATKRITYTFGLGFDKNQQDGFLHFNKFTPEPLSNTFGSLLTFAPLIADSIDSGVDANGSDAIAPFILAAVEIGVAVAIGVTGVFKMERVTLYGAELNVSQALVGNYDFEDSEFTELSALFDYAVDFKIDLDLGIIKIQSTDGKPLRVRYNALGFKLDFQNDGAYSPVFDTSKGYEFAMADPGLLTVSDPFGSILKVLGARVSRVNPLNIEFDLGINANLGIISVEQIKVKIPVDPLGVPTIIPTKASVNIPGTFIGTGYIDLSNGIKGSIDITIVPIKLRLQASIGINPIEADGRKVTAFYLGLGVEFPAPIPIGGSGLGLYGVLGLFGMHYKRNENVNAGVPALDWLNNIVHGNPTDIVGWDPNLDKWAFGIGAVLGTVDAGFTLNLKGMLILELPGPRILIMVNLKMLSIKPGTEGEVTAGLLAVVDLDFNLNKLTIGVLINYEIKGLISLKIPVEAAFGFEDLSKWHLYIGSIASPVSAEVLGIVKAQGYFMIDGDKIDNFPGPSGLMTLEGLAIAMGLKAYVIFGDESSGLYLKVTAGFDAGISFSPLHVYGVMELRGKLRLFIISISAWATLKVEAPNPTYLIGEACGKVDFFFFSVKGCVTIKIGNKPPSQPAPELLNGMVLQSRSPALVLGQGSDRPIDGSLGNAKEVNSVSNVTDNNLLRVPLDAIPILKFIAPAQQDSGFTTFTKTIIEAPKLTSSGWIKQGENRQVKYTIKNLTINPPIQLDGLGNPPATWISNQSNAKGIDTSVDLALLSWIPDATPRAIQRSQELTEKIKKRWASLCDEVAPEACILWTFNNEQLGYSASGWNLNGDIWPDPPNTERNEEVNNEIHVFEDYGFLNDPLFEQLLNRENGIQLDHAKVIGDVLAGLDLNSLGLDPSNKTLTHLAIQPKRHFGKVLELPYLYGYTTKGKNSLKLSDKYKKMVLNEPQKIVVDTKGEASFVRLLIAVHDGTNLQTITIRGYDKEDNEVEIFTANDVLEVSNVHGGNLPSKWSDPTGPWLTEVAGVLSYLAREQNHLEKYILKWEPTKKVVKFDIFVDESKRKLNYPPSMLLCAIQLCKEEEKRRFEHESEVKETMIEMVESALTGGQLKPLLEPNTRYTISMIYDGHAKELDNDGNWNERTDEFTQLYTFMTDETSPAKLNPWVLLTSPFDNNPYHFTEDAVEIYFNDASAIQLYEKYGDNLIAVLRKANGDHANTEPPIDMASLADVDAAILTPFEETLRTVLSDKDCIKFGESEKHRKFVLNIPLDRGTEYTLDIEIDGASAPISPTNPLFRVAFKTSRFSSSEELAGIMNQAYINHKRLENPLTILGSNPSDQDIEDVLINAGLEAIIPSKNPSYAYLWQPVGSSHKLVAILIDAPEPLWRVRNLPIKETIVSNSGDMEHWVLEENNYLRIEETSGISVVDKIVHSPGGTRTIVYLNNNNPDIELSLIQKGIVLDGSSGPEITHVILNTELPSKTPWELNEITD